MRYSVKKFKNLKLALKELEPFIKDGNHLLTGKPFPQFDQIRSRELLANWLVCAVLNDGLKEDKFVFTSDPTGGDGIILDSESEETWPTEHVMVPPEKYARTKDLNILERILEAISLKRIKGGAAYASGKQLIVFVESNGGEWYPNIIMRTLPPQIDFDGVWIAGLQKAEDNQYTYAVTQLDTSQVNAPTWLICIDPFFSSWKTQRIQ